VYVFTSYLLSCGLLILTMPSLRGNPQVIQFLRDNQTSLLPDRVQIPDETINGGPSKPASSGALDPIQETDETLPMNDGVSALNPVEIDTSPAEVGHRLDSSSRLIPGIAQPVHDGLGRSENSSGASRRPNKPRPAPPTRAATRSSSRLRKPESTSSSQVNTPAIAPSLNPPLVEQYDDDASDLTLCPGTPLPDDCRQKSVESEEYEVEAILDFKYKDVSNEASYLQQD